MSSFLEWSVNGRDGPRNWTRKHHQMFRPLKIVFEPHLIPDLDLGTGIRMRVVYNLLKICMIQISTKPLLMGPKRKRNYKAHMLWKKKLWPDKIIQFKKLQGPKTNRLSPDFIMQSIVLVFLLQLPYRLTSLKRWSFFHHTSL
ncbi:hypothetical protein O6H91_08G047400 [Diphasiastrum complanatum]|uniref:Uncharacterized protein n=1 Tax=Diphasiastrum complanatum TaxID=34168 RepID=A0ACC2CXE8_DIPCM|nr:hypothetical protein O6H91_Y068700 [Diphasiastrum complanatum]KAJ7546625.1 hypothetical protein O6H91_08G047400 [Diphasiastrum complanatum]